LIYLFEVSVQMMKHYCCSCSCLVNFIVVLLIAVFFLFQLFDLVSPSLGLQVFVIDFAISC